MKPIKLEFQAFGPFKDKMVIDFNEFTDQGLFLITGPTGSGKTTIFDAIFYALYGQLSSSDRKSLGAPAKSQFASDETLCYVELEFEAKGKIYTLYRQPQQMGKGVRKDLVTLDAKAQLTSTHFSLDRISEVQAEVNSILGLTAEQFKQIVLLPQGEFKDLLFASSTEKEVIFRDLFKTQDIQQFTERLKLESDELTRLIKYHQQSINIHLNNIDKTDEQLVSWIDSQQYDLVLDYIESEKNKFQEQINQQTQILDRLTKQTNELQQQINLQAELTKAETQRDELIKQEAAIQELKRLSHKIEDLITLSSKLAELKRVSQRVELTHQSKKKHEEVLNTHKLKEELMLKEFETIQKAYTQIGSWEEKSSELREQSIKYTKLLENFNQKKRLETQNQASQTKLTELLKETEKENTEITVLSNSLKELAKVEKQKTTLNKQLSELNTNLLITKEKETLFNKLKELIESINKETGVFTELKEKKHKVDQELSHAEIIQQEQIAGVLAQTLKDDEPCPVCGSIHHPDIAQLKDETITDEQIEALRKKQSDVLIDFSSSSQRLKSFSEHQEQLLNTLNLELDQVESEHKKLMEHSNNQQDELNNLNKSIQKLENELEKKEVVSLNLDKTRESLVQHKLEITREETNINSRKDDIERLNKTLENEDLLNEEQLLKLKHQIEALNDKIKETRQLREKKQSEIHEIQKEIVETESSLVVLKQNLSQQTSDKLELEKEYENLLVEKNLTHQEVSDSNYTKEDILKTQEKIDAYYQEVNQVKGIITSLTNQLKQMGELHPNPHTLKIEVDQQIKEFNQSSRTLHGKWLTYESAFESIQKENTEYQVVVKRHQEVYPLYLAASGDRSVGYLSFERYVLAAFFEEVLEFANERLMAMTEDRFYLTVMSEGLSRQRSAGLDLEIFDNHVSNTRSVKTLSGGETFKASLALALGLSDVISQKSGGIHIDALFIDEGFGTLDEQSLDQAIETLLSINQDGRLVGIISHVNEFKERIPHQIQVNKDQEGSSLTIIN